MPKREDQNRNLFTKPQSKRKHEKGLTWRRKKLRKKGQKRKLPRKPPSDATNARKQKRKRKMESEERSGKSYEEVTKKIKGEKPFSGFFKIKSKEPRGNGAINVQIKERH